MELTPFENSSAVPAFMKQDKSANSDLLNHSHVGFASLSIRGKCFAIVKDGNRTVLKNPKDPDSNASFVDVVMLKVSPYKSKAFYKNGYDANAEDLRPTCFSSDGIKPDASVENPQCKSCAACPYNQFKSASGNGEGVRKGKACPDYIRIAIAAPDNVDEPIALRIPPTSIRTLGEYARVLEKHKAPYQGVITRISFVPEEATPRLTFKAISFVDKATYDAVKEQAESDMVRTMVFGGSTAVEQVEESKPSVPTQPLNYAQQEADEALAKAVKEADKKRPDTDATGMTLKEAEAQSALNQALKATETTAPKATAKSAPKQVEPIKAVDIEDASDQDLESILDSLGLE